MNGILLSIIVQYTISIRNTRRPGRISGFILAGPSIMIGCFCPFCIDIMASIIVNPYSRTRIAIEIGVVFVNVDHTISLDIYIIPMIATMGSLKYISSSSAWLGRRVDIVASSVLSICLNGDCCGNATDIIQ